jgi:hypothetical protein
VKTVLGAIAGISVLTACGGGLYNPAAYTTAPVDVQDNSALVFRVGTALFSDGTVGLNTVVTFRSTTGGSATTVNTPTITGPAGFTVPDNPQTDPSVAAKNTDVGTNKISGTPGGGTTITTFGTAGGAFSYGFANANEAFGTGMFAQFVGTTADNSALYQDLDSTIVVGSGKGNVQKTIAPAALDSAGLGAIGNAYPSPLYAIEPLRLPFLIGPPAVPDFHNANTAAGFLGYDSGFISFAATPVAGSYSLTVVVPATVQQSSASFTEAATLASVAPLGAESTAVVISSTGDGGATFTVAAPPAGVTNQTLYVVDVAAKTAVPTMYTFRADTAGVSTLSATSGPVVGTTAGAPFATGDSIYAYVVGSDYDLLAAAPPSNVVEAPTLPAQTDITVSKVTEVVYPATGVTGPLFRRTGPLHH